MKFTCNLHVIYHLDIKIVPGLLRNIFKNYIFAFECKIHNWGIFSFNNSFIESILVYKIDIYNICNINVVLIIVIVINL